MDCCWKQTGGIFPLCVPRGCNNLGLEAMNDSMWWNGCQIQKLKKWIGVWVVRVRAESTFGRSQSCQIALMGMGVKDVKVRRKWLEVITEGILFGEQDEAKGWVSFHEEGRNEALKGSWVQLLMLVETEQQ